MTSVEFSVRFVERVIIRARMFGKEVFENVKVSFNNIIKHYLPYEWYLCEFVASMDKGSLELWSGKQIQLLTLLLLCCKTFYSCFYDVTQVVTRSGRAEMFILTGVIKLPANTQAIQLAMVPTTEPRLGSPQLRKVDVQMCCDGAYVRM